MTPTRLLLLASAAKSSRRPSTSVIPTRRHHRYALRSMHDRVLVCEQLEDRRMLSTIAWTNRGTGPGPGDTDGFDSLFGAQANLARQHVDRAIRDWQNVIVDFNYDGDNNPATNNTLNLSLNTSNLGASLAQAAPTAVNANGLPTVGTITVHNNAGSHWLDPTPFDDSEFGATTTNLFTGYAAGFAGTDFYATVVHELGHVVGFTINNPALAIANFLTMSVDDPNTTNPGNLFAFNVGGGPIEATFTASDTGHLWEGPATTATTNAGLPIHVETLMNPGRAIAFNERNLISNTEAFILHDAYGYQIALPQDNMAIVRNDLTGGVTVRGQAGLTFNDLVIGASATPGFIELKINENVELAPLTNTSAIVVDLGNGNDSVELRPLSSSVQFNLTDSAGASDELEIVGGGGYDNIVVNGADITSTAVNVKMFGGFERLVISPGEGDADISLPDTGLFTSARITDFGSAPQTINLHRLDEGTPTLIGLAFGTNTVNIAPGASTDAIRSAITIQGGPLNDTVHLAPAAPSSIAVITAPVTFNGGAGSDTLNVGGGNADAVAADIAFDGQSGPNNTLLIHDQSPVYVVAYDVGPGFVVRDGLLNPWTLTYANVQTLAIGAGLSADTFNVHNAPSTNVTIFGNDGNDTFTVGNGNMGIANADFSGLFGGGGVDTLVLDDSAFAGAADWIINSTAVFRGTLGVQEFGYAGFEGVSVLTGLGGSVGDDIAINGPIRVNVAVSGGVGSDAFVLTDVDNYQDFFDQDENPPFHYAMNLDGGGGFNSLLVNDAASVDRSYSIWPDRVLVDEGAPLGLDFTYDSFQSVTIQAPANPVQFAPRFDVYGTSADIPSTHQMSILGTGINDQFVIHPRDLTGNLTINGNLGIGGGGGTDTLTVDDATSPVPINYTFYNQFGPGTTNIGGLGAGGFGAGSDVENIVVNAGAGDDAFALYSFEAPSSLSVNAGDGVDKFDVAPTARSLAAEVLGMSSFTFDGGPTGYDSFSLFNENNPDPWTITRTAAGVVTHNVATGKTTVWNLPNSEYLNAFGGSQADTFLIEATPTSGPTYNSFLGACGNDNYIVGRNGRTNLITANIAIVNDAGVDSATIDNSAETTPGTAHVTEYFVGGAVGDDYFGPGGYLYHVNLAGTMTVKMGGGADTVYATPNVSTTVRLEGGNPATAPGDILGLAFANVTNPVFTALPLGQSQYTFGNASPVTYVGFEQTTIDATAPAVTSQSYTEAGLAAIVVQFNDRVFDTPVPIHPYYLEIVNTATSQRIPFENVALSYNSLSNVATFTFPGYASGRPPAGSYSARVLAGPTDFSGNFMLAQPAFSFTATAPATGDFDGDGVVGAADLALWTTSVGASAAGDADSDGDTDGNDFLMWQRRLGQPAAASAAQSLAAAERAGTPSWAAIDEALSVSERAPYRPASRRIQTMVSSALNEVQPRRDASRAGQRLDWIAIAQPSTSDIVTTGSAGRAALEAAIDNLLDEAWGL